LKIRINNRDIIKKKYKNNLNKTTQKSTKKSKKNQPICYIRICLRSKGKKWVNGWEKFVFGRVSIEIAYQSVSERAAKALMRGDGATLA
jgi:hypothetical protein